MKILIITPTYAPAWNFGGTVAAMTQLANALNSQKNVTVTVYTTNASSENNKLAVDLGVPHKVGGVKTYYFDCGRWNNSAFHSKELLQNVKKNIDEFDIIYLSAIWQILGYKCAKVCIKNTKPFVMGTHGSFSKALRRKSKLKKTIYHQLLLKPILKKANAIHTSGEQEIKDSGGWLNNYNHIKIPNIVNSSKYYLVNDHLTQENFKKNHHIPIKSKVILTVCRPDWMKRVDVLLDVIKDNNDYCLVYVGNIKNEIVDEWKNKANRLKINERFICTGELRGEELLQAYSISDIFSLISTNENFSMVVVEAMLCGSPVIISKEVGVGEYLKENPYCSIVDLNKDSISLEISKIQNISFDKDKVRKTGLELFSEDKIASNFIAAFEEIISDNKKL